MSEELELDLVEPWSPSATRNLREYQVACVKAVQEGWKQFSRQLCVIEGGGGKTICFSHLTKDEVARGGRVLILAHTDELLEQAIDKLFRATGITADKEKADQHASLSARVVVASIQTLSRENRLLNFPDDHFTEVHQDEAHRSLAPSFLRVLNYFHFGVESLHEGWKPPEPGAPYKHKARICGWTATPSRGDARSLGEFYQNVAYQWTLLEAVHDGYLARPIVKQIPLQLDMRGIKTSRSGGQGADLDLGEVTSRITPFLRLIAKEIAIHAPKLKTVVFMPSIETARLLAQAICDEGLAGQFVSGECPDRAEKILAFRAAGPGTVICNAMLIVEGFDVPDITAVCLLRPTKIWGFYKQAVLRGSRTLPGVIDGLTTREARLAAIARSAKPFFTILDFLWLSDRMDLICPFDLVTTNQGVRDIMAVMSGDDLVAMEAQAEKDFLAALMKEAKKHAKKASRTIDPIALAVTVGDTALALWQPETAWDELPPTTGQLAFLQRQHLDVSAIKHRGFAQRLVLRLLTRFKAGLCSYEQIVFLRRMGIPEDQTVMLTRAQASAAIDSRKKELDARRLR